MEGTPDQQLFTDIQNLNAFNSQQLEEFVGVVLSFLKEGIGNADRNEALVQFGEAHGVNVKALRTTFKGVMTFFSEALKKNMSFVHAKEDLVQLGLEETKASLLSDKYKVNFISMSSSMIEKTLTVNELVDMEWKFGVTASSDELNKVGTCFLQLKLVIDRGNKEKENVVIELSLPQFYQFLHQMEKASRQLQV